MSKYWMAIVFSMLMLLNACAVVKSKVTVFHNLPDPLPHMTFAFLPIEGQESSLEYAKYRGMISQELTKYQFTEVPIDQAQLLITFGYGVGSGKQNISSIPQFGQTGVSSSNTYGTVGTYGNYGTYSGTTTYTPQYGVTGYQTVSRTIYGRYVWLDIFDGVALKNGEAKKLYEASLVSTGKSSQIAEVMPALIAAIFKEFPGVSGETRKVRVTLDR